jgi:hypothetical protein
MNILVNLLSIKSGGGQKVAFNFVKETSQINSKHNIHYIVTRDTWIANYLETSNIKNVVHVEQSLVSRMWFHYITAFKIVNLNKIDVIYTLFGISINNTNAMSVVGSAYSNIYYPNEPFWPRTNKVKYMLFRIRDYYRLRSTLNADAIVFENDSMMRQARSVYGVSPERSIFIPPSYSTSDSDIELNSIHQTRAKKVYQGLMLTGYHFNKNIEIVPAILKELNQLKSGIRHTISISIDESDPRLQSIKAKAEKYDVHSQINFIGIIKPDKLNEVYARSDYVLLLSGMESFSNNIIEAWVYEKPLIISDKPWARSICKDAAIYVERRKSSNIAYNIDTLQKNNALYTEVISKGKKELTHYPTPEDKVRRQYEFIETIFNSR